IISQAVLIQQSNRFAAQAFNIHSFAGNKMLYPTDDLWWTTVEIRAIMLCFAFGSYQACTTLGASLNIANRLGILRSVFGIYTNNFRNDFSSFFNHYMVANAYVQLFDLVGIMQRCSFNNRTCQFHRFEIRNRRNRPCSSYLIINTIQGRYRLFCLKFIGNRPTWIFSGIAQFFLLIQIVYLNNYAVCFVRQIVAGSVPIINIVKNFVHVIE